MGSQTVGVVPNIERDKGLSVTRGIVSFLGGRGVRAALTEEAFAALPDAPANAFAARNVAAAADWVVAIGGDGTILRAANEAARLNKPILGVNAGRLGYLAGVEKQDAITALERALDGRFTTERRMMLRAAFADGRVETALNDICVSRETNGMAAFRLSIGGVYVDTVLADGVIVSTPTGSTAYSLSAGGPIARPDARLIIITPICPHTLYARPWVLSGDDEIEIQIERGQAHAMADGRRVEASLPVTVRRAEAEATMMVIGQLGFYDVLRRKMMGRTERHD